ncbi:hypothetical protein, unlikely [Trypanosoma brucei gambiense DAL972]|uniref:Uncharacterized protein n=1 Tax=Trypanosoma brucei gambiense (strain MHOM/CI/86/DAL972) TaxID=679716 RepID=D0A3Y4_TRYB9|nr:hypothetical protein, unlikely [Trypanosoma brucei gambiense DAL972]CBH15978.1 hypothetical protein, unlikely [Trypanosoma brucei gambiense DAL972]|eukprot:XP_011778242.1 hypothetical protein, unlikely [Trypanosoma brucei gambiense DAL972]
MRGSVTCSITSNSLIIYPFFHCLCCEVPEHASFTRGERSYQCFLLPLHILIGTPPHCTFPGPSFRGNANMCIRTWCFAVRFECVMFSDGIMGGGTMYQIHCLQESGVCLPSLFLLCACTHLFFKNLSSASHITG